MILTEEGIAVVEGDTHLSAAIINEHRLDLAVVRELLDQLHPYIPVGGGVVDVGACLGDHTLAYAKRVGAGGRVYAFEPNPIALDCLRHNLRQYPQVVIWGDALGDRQGVCDVQPDPIMPGNLGMANVVKGSTIPIRTLDSVSMGWPRLDFMKIDVEGLEEAVLRGAERTIIRHRPAILLEVNEYALGRHQSTKVDLYALLTLWGYGFVPVMDSTTASHQERFAQPEIDVLAIPRDRFPLHQCWQIELAPEARSMP